MSNMLVVNEVAVLFGFVGSEKYMVWFGSANPRFGQPIVNNYYNTIHPCQFL
jgi:hypothetical protein